jgi:hypothetical protein
MPISPAEAKKKRRQNNVLEYQLVCAEVDKSLIEGLSPAGEHWVACKLIPMSMRDQFIEDYQDAGWNVRVERDRDGDAFVLSPKSQR